LRQQDTFTQAHWDFAGEESNGTEDIWDICEGANYPRFIWQILPADFLCPDGVDFLDYAVFADQWQLEKLQQDYNSDGCVNLKDYANFANSWNSNYAELLEFVSSWLARSAGEADIAPDGGDNFVDWQDLMLLCENWLEQ
jgi:hypothetical protein